MRLILYSALTLFLAGCHRFHRLPKEYHVIGAIDSSGVSGPVIQAPSTVHVGESFEVIVTTRGSSCVRAEGADVEVKGLVALITPRDIVNYAHGCLEYDAPYSRSVKVRFDRVGPGVLRVYGLSDRKPVIKDQPILVTAGTAPR